MNQETSMEKNSAQLLQAGRMEILCSAQGSGSQQQQNHLPG